MKACVCYDYDCHTHSYTLEQTGWRNVYLHAHPGAAVGDMTVAGVAVLE